MKHFKSGNVSVEVTGQQRRGSVMSQFTEVNIAHVTSASRPAATSDRSGQVQDFQPPIAAEPVVTQRAAVNAWGAERRITDRLTTRLTAAGSTREVGAEFSRAALRSGISAAPVEVTWRPPSSKSSKISKITHTKRGAHNWSRSRVTPLAGFGAGCSRSGLHRNGGVSARVRICRRVNRCSPPGARSARDHDTVTPHRTTVRRC